MLNEYNYNLPDELIAQSPLKNRSDSKLMVLNRSTGEVNHKVFSDLIDYLSDGDVLVVNDTKVIPARLIGKKDTGAVIEILLLKEIDKDVWECLVKPQRRVKLSNEVVFSDKLKAVCIDVKDEGISVFKLVYEGILMEILDELGSMPLPPYIHEKLDDKDRYQTIYATNIGSAAAPTAGLHFTPFLLDEIKKKGILVVTVTLHVGLGTFRPVNVDNINDHKMHSEYYEMSKETAVILNKAKDENRRIIPVGTTSVRTIESVYNKFNKFVECNGETDIFIYPGYEFKATDALITNFHLPKSTLLMLVSALSSKEVILNAYNEAIRNKYRFFSFGDAMFIY